MKKIDPELKAKHKKEYDYAYYRRPDVMEKERIRQRGRFAYKKRLTLLKMYGITFEDYDKML